MKKNGILIVYIIIILLALSITFGKSVLFVVSELENAIVIQLGKPVRIITDPGLYFKKPFIQAVHRLEKRIINWDGEPTPMPTRDKLMITVDCFGRWKITDPQKFYLAVRDVRGGNKRMDDIIDSVVRNVVGNNDLIELVRTSNRELMYRDLKGAGFEAPKQITIKYGREKLERLVVEAAQKNLGDSYGMELIDVRFKRINYAPNVQKAVYSRMRSERERIAEYHLSMGRRRQKEIMGTTSKELDEIRGTSRKKAAELVGEADAAVISIYAEALVKAPDFYTFIRKLEMYRKSFGTNSKLLLTTDSDLYNLLSKE